MENIEKDIPNASDISDSQELQNIIDQLPHDKVDNIDNNANNNDNNEDKIINSLDSNKEKLISQHLDFCLEHGNLSNLPISTLSRIFNSPERILHNHHLLFKFVSDKLKNHEQKNKDEKDSNEIYILINSLDYNEIGEDEIIELLDNYDSIENIKSFSPCNSHKIIKALIENNKFKEKEIETIKEELDKLKQVYECQQKEHEKIYEHITILEKRFEEAACENMNIQEKLSQCSSQNVSKLESKISEFRSLNENKYNEISARLNKIEQNIERMNGLHNHFLYKENQEFKGIFNHFLDLSNGDINKYVNVITSSVENSSNVPMNAFLYDDKDKYFATGNTPNSWICFDFKDYQIIPTNYTIRSYNQDSCNPKSWVIEGTNNDKNEGSWENLDNQKNNDKLNGKNITYTFSIPNSNQKPFRFIRMRETDKNWRNDNYLCFNSIEFYLWLLKVKKKDFLLIFLYFCVFNYLINN